MQSHFEYRKESSHICKCHTFGIVKIKLYLIQCMTILSTLERFQGIQMNWYIIITSILEIASKILATL